MPRAKSPTRKRAKSYANLSELIRDMPAPDTVSDGQIRQMLLQLILDNPDDKPDPMFRRMNNKLVAFKLLHEMNHVKDKDDELSNTLLEALSNRGGQAR